MVDTLLFFLFVCFFNELLQCFCGWESCGWTEILANTTIAGTHLEKGASEEGIIAVAIILHKA